MMANDLSVADLMSTAVMTVEAHASIDVARADMEIGVIRHLPVLDDRRRLVGVLSDRDVLRAAGAHGPIAEFMTREVVTIQSSEPAHAAAQLMLELRIGSLPVIDDDGTLVGVVTQTDYLEVARRALLGLPLER